MSDEFDTLEEIADMVSYAHSPATAQGRSAKSRAAGRRYYAAMRLRGVVRSSSKLHRASVRSCAPITLPVIKAFDE
jgi:hypothetical protein